MMQEALGPARNTPVGTTPYLDTANTALLTITLIGIGVMLWAEIDDRCKGLR